MMLGKGKEYIDGELEIKNGTYKLNNATVVIGDEGIKSISDGDWEKIK